MPEPLEGEIQKDFISRCVPLVIEDGTAKDPKQAAAICYSKWREAKKEAEVAKQDKALLDGEEGAGEVRSQLQQSLEELFRPPPTLAAPEQVNYSPVPWICDSWPSMQEVIVKLGGKYYRTSYTETDGGYEFSPRDEWKEVTERREWIEAAEKAGRCLRTSKLRFVQDLKDRFSKLMDDMGAFLGWATYDDKPEIKGTHGIKLFKGKDKKDWLLVWSTNGFEDRDEETFRTKAIENYVQRHADDETKGAFDFWHIPGTEFGTIRWQGMSGRFLAEMGTFDDTKIGQAFKAFFEAHPDSHEIISPEGWGASHEFSYRAEDRKDGVYDWFEKQKTTVLPGNAAANPHNPKMEVMSVNKQQIDALKAIEDETGADGLIDLIMKTGEEKTKELEAAGVSHKAAAETEATEPNGPTVNMTLVVNSETASPSVLEDFNLLKGLADGEKAGKPSDYLVVEDEEKPTTWHLQVMKNGKVDHGLMGAAWAALHEGYRGNKYEGPKKGAAIKKLTALYESEDMTVPGKKDLTAFVKDLLGADKPKAETKEAEVDEEKVETKPEEEVVPEEEKPTDVEELRSDTEEALKVFGGVLVEIRDAVKGLTEKIEALALDDETKIKQVIEETPKASLKARAESIIGRKETRIDGRTTLGKDHPKETEAPIERATGIPFLDKMLGPSELPN